jgi:hypothetical protein
MREHELDQSGSGKDKWGALVRTVTYIPFLYNEGEFIELLMTSYPTTLSRTLFHLVSQSVGWLVRWLVI